MFGKGISKEGDILDLATKLDLVKKSGAWYAYESDKIGQGRENAKTYLSAHPEIMEELEKKVREHYQLGTDSSEKDEKEVKKEKEQKGKSDDLALKGDEK